MKGLNGGSATHTAPDGGWGWMVVFASFWINGLTLGQLKTFGVLLPQLTQQYGSTTAQTAWINGVGFAITFAFGKPKLSNR